MLLHKWLQKFNTTLTLAGKAVVGSNLGGGVNLSVDVDVGIFLDGYS